MKNISLPILVDRLCEIFIVGKFKIALYYENAYKKCGNTVDFVSISP